MDFEKLFSELKKSGVKKLTMTFEFNDDVPTKVVTIDGNEENKADKTVKTTASASREELKLEKPNYYSLDEIANMTQISKGYVSKLTRDAKCPFVRVGRIKYYDIATLWEQRYQHENDVITHDGDRRGGTKFICSALEKHIK